MDQQTAIQQAQQYANQAQQYAQQAQQYANQAQQYAQISSAAQSAANNAISMANQAQSEAQATQQFVNQINSMKVAGGDYSFAVSQAQTMAQNTQQYVSLAQQYESQAQQPSQQAPTTVTTTPTTVITTPITIAQPTTGTLSITYSPSDANLYIDGSFRGYSGNGFTTSLSPGQHTMRLSKTGYQDYITTVYIAASQTTFDSYQLSVVTTTPTTAITTPTTIAQPTTGTLSIICNPKDAILYIDGTYYGYAGNGFTTTLSSGQHTIFLIRNGYQEYSDTVYVLAGNLNSVSYQMAPNQVTVVTTVIGSGITTPKTETLQNSPNTNPTPSPQNTDQQIDVVQSFVENEDRGATAAGLVYDAKDVVSYAGQSIGKEASTSQSVVNAANGANLIENAGNVVGAISNGITAYHAIQSMENNRGDAVDKFNLLASGGLSIVAAGGTTLSLGAASIPSSLPLAVYDITKFTADRINSPNGMKLFLEISPKEVHIKQGNSVTFTIRVVNHYIFGGPVHDASVYADGDFIGTTNSTGFLTKAIILHNNHPYVRFTSYREPDFPDCQPSDVPVSYE